MPDESHLYHLEYDNDDPGEDEEECEVCGGTGLIPKVELEGDWVNWSSRKMVVCPECCDENF